MNPLLLSSSTLLTLTFNSSQRLISRVVLIPFGDNMDEVSMPPSTRDLADRELQQCMMDGYKAAGVMVSVGKVVCDSHGQDRLFTTWRFAEDLCVLLLAHACNTQGVCMCVCVCVCAHTTFTS